MEIHIVDLKTNTEIKFIDCKQFKNINIGHKISVTHKNEHGINEYINGTICSIEHKINKYDKDYSYKLKIKVY